MLLRTLLVTATVGIAACTSAGGSPRSVAAGTSVTLDAGERVSLPDRAMLRFVGVRDDSRCPPGVQCIRAGDATVDFEVVPAGGRAESLTLNEPERRSGRAGGWAVTIESLTQDADPRVTVRVDAP